MAAGSLNPLVSKANEAAASKGMVGRGGAGTAQAGATAKAASPAQKPAPVAPPADTKPPEEAKLAPLELLVFPSDFPKYGMVLKFGPYSRRTALEDVKLNHDLHMWLPIPANLGEAFRSNYNNNLAFGPLMNELLTGFSQGVTAMQSGASLKQAAGMVKDSVVQNVKNGANDRSLQAGLFRKAASGFGEAGGAAADMMTGMTPNPHLAVAYQGPTLRVLNFSWRFAPQSYQESVTMMKIINAFKARALPEKKQYALTFPDMVDIELVPSVMSDVVKFKTCFITDVKVNYAPNGVPSFFAKSNVPTEAEVSITLQETKIFTREDFAAPVIPTDPKAATPPVATGDEGE